MLRLAGQEIPAYMEAQPLPGLGLTDRPPRSRIFGMLTKGWICGYPADASIATTVGHDYY